MTVLEGSPTHSPRSVVPYFYRYFSSIVSKTTIIVLKKMFFSYMVWTITQSTGRRDSFLNGRKMWVDFRILENPSSRRTVFSLESPLTFCCYFIKGKTK